MRATSRPRNRPGPMLGVAGALLAVFLACQEVTIPDQNSPSADQLSSNPNRTIINEAAVGLMSGMRDQVGSMAQRLGILGREAYLLDPAAARFVTSYLVGPLAPGSFGVDLDWTTSYRMLRTAVIILDAVNKVSTYTPAQRESIRGFVKTVMAIEYMNQLRIRDTLGIVLDIAADPTPLQPFVSRDSGWARTAALLDEAQAHLRLAGGAAFPFPLTSGFESFNTPVIFMKVNRAIKARVDVYRERWDDALADLGGSFLSTESASAASLATGVYHVYSTASGDAINYLFDATPVAQVAVPSFLTDAQTAADGTPDKRASSKAVVGPVTLKTQGVSSNVKITRYANSVAPVPIIKNEELILLRAEANYHMGNTVAALQDLNFVRVNSGGLAPLPIPWSGDIVSEILYNRRYSLFYEYGHRWVDMRRYGRLAQLEKALPEHRRFPYVPFPNNECEQRPLPKPRGCLQVNGF